jgi:DNA mismatch endonuclease (patch repair protein)
MPPIGRPPSEISNRMKRVRRRHTAVERKLAAALRKVDLRFLTHQPICGCTPDIVFGSERLIVFVDGDFWHGRILLESGKQALQKTFKPEGRDFWVTKICRNADRDQRQCRILRRNGWSVLRLWEKDVLRNSAGAATVVVRSLKRRRRLKRKLGVA